jgi:hypothetical protein
MAVTLRNFLYGLGQAAPAIAQTIQNYYVMGMQERQINLQEMESMTRQEMYKAETEKVETDTDLAKKRFKIELAKSEIETDTAKIANRFAKANESALINTYGGLDEAAKKDIEYTVKKREGEINKLTQEIQTLKATESNQDTQRWLAKLDGELTISKFNLDTMSFALGAVDNPQDRVKVEEALKNATNPETGMLDVRKLNEIWGTLDLQSAMLKEAGLRLLPQVLEHSNQWLQFKEQAKQSLINTLMEDPKQLKAAGLDGKPYEAVDNYANSVMDLRFGKGSIFEMQAGNFNAIMEFINKAWGQNKETETGTGTTKTYTIYDAYLDAAGEYGRKKTMEYISKHPQGGIKGIPDVQYKAGK